jgi:hypothetical protein
MCQEPANEKRHCMNPVNAHWQSDLWDTIYIQYNVLNQFIKHTLLKLAENVKNCKNGIKHFVLFLKWIWTEIFAFKILEIPFTVHVFLPFKFEQISSRPSHLRSLKLLKFSGHLFWFQIYQLLRFFMLTVRDYSVMTYVVCCKVKVFIIQNYEMRSINDRGVLFCKQIQ